MILNGKRKMAARMMKDGQEENEEVKCDTLYMLSACAHEHFFFYFLCGREMGPKYICRA